MKKKDRKKKSYIILISIILVIILISIITQTSYASSSGSCTGNKTFDNTYALYMTYTCTDNVDYNGSKAVKVAVNLYHHYYSKQQYDSNKDTVYFTVTNSVGASVLPSTKYSYRPTWNVTRSGDPVNRAFGTGGALYAMETHSPYTITVYGYDKHSTKTATTCSKTCTVPALPSYAVTLETNGGTIASTSLTKWFNESLTLPSPTKNGFTFVGWNTASDGSGTNYFPGSSYTGNAALTLYAQWSQDYVGVHVGFGL